MKIKEAKIGPMPKTLFDALPEVRVTYEDGTEEKLFSFYPDEISFTSGELIGLTREEVFALRHQKDVSYLKS